MAVEAYLANWTNDQGVNAVREGSGIRKHYMQNTASIAIADDSLSTYLLFKNVPYKARIASLLIECAAITSLNDADIGLFDSTTGVAVDADCLADGLDLSAAKTKILALDGNKENTHANSLKCLYEYTTDTISERGPARATYDIVLTAKADPTGAGDVTARMELIPAG